MGVGQFVAHGYKSFPCVVAIGQYLRVKLTAGDLVVAGAEADIGTLQAATFGAGTIMPQSGSVRLPNDGGTHVMVAAAAITSGVVVYAAAAGQVSAAVNAFPVGIALEAATAQGDLLEVLPLRSIGMPGVATDVAAITDNSGGASGAGTIAAITDVTTPGCADFTTTKNAVATLAAEVNAILTNLKAAGLMA